MMITIDAHLTFYWTQWLINMFYYNFWHSLQHPIWVFFWLVDVVSSQELVIYHDKSDKCSSFDWSFNISEMVAKKFVILAISSKIINNQT